MVLVGLTIGAAVLAAADGLRAVADRIGMRMVAAFGGLMTALGLAVSAVGQTWALFLGSAVLIGLSLAGGLDPNGSFPVTCSSHVLPAAGLWASGTVGSATDPGKDGQL